LLAIACQVVLLSAIVAWMVTPLTIRFAARIGAMDLPGGRKIHTQPIPRVGGIAIFAGFLVGLGYAEFHDMVPYFGVGRASIYWVMLLAAFGLFLLGLVDDLRGVGFAGKFAIQILAAMAVWTAGFRIEILAFGSTSGAVHLGWLSLPFTVLWVVGVTNAVNLIDGLDGLAAGLALITTIAVAVMALLSGQTGVVAASAALLGSLLGFLPYNFNPARIFLGDSGSMFLGFVIAVISIRGNQKGPTAVAALAPLLVVGLPILDTALALARRSWRIGRDGWRTGAALRYMWRNGHRLFLPDREHLHHRLLDLGLSQRRAVLTLYVMAIGLAAAALVDVVSNSRLVAMLLVGVLAATVSGLAVMHHLGRRHRARTLAETGGGASVTLPVGPGRAAEN
jgi:UDP-GlcNAc:undecaprenyl-phosphate/decaprenyl-phosphate GlcNAc-1-phosphate transferase